MTKMKKKRTAAQRQANRAAKAERQKTFMWVLMNGKQVRVKKPATIDGIPMDEYIRRNADPIWLHQNEMYEEIHAKEKDSPLGEQNGRMSKP